VQAAGVDPYRYPPTAPQLARLHVRWLWPSAAACRAMGRPPGCVRISRPNDRTIYPPVAEAWFLGVHAAVGSEAGERAWQVAGLVVDLAVLAVMLALLRDWGRDPRRLVFYAWCPLAVLEAVQNAHVDGLAALLVLLALWAVHARRAALAGALVAAATLVKLYPAVLVVLLLRGGRRRALAGFAAVAVAGYLPHVLAVGPRVLGYLPGYLHDENYAAGGRFLLLGALGAHGMAAQLLAAGVLAAVAAVAWWQSRDTDVTARPDVPARRLLGALLLVATPVQPWYAVPLVAVAALDGAWWWLAVAAAGYPLFFHSLEGVPLPALPAFDVGRLAYGAALAAVVLGGTIAARRHRLTEAAA
jgi:hypothetical protein